MQTFITHVSSNPQEVFAETAKALDDKRLNKQALEAWQILMTNLQLNPDGTRRNGHGWRNHPATLMWTGCEAALLEYIQGMVAEWHSRGHQSTIAVKAQQTHAHALEKNLVPPEVVYPQWLVELDRCQIVVDTHRKALAVKNWEHYKPYGWHKDRPTTYDYVWYPSGYSAPVEELGVVLG
jgi:hypothetical protein